MRRADPTDNGHAEPVTGRRLDTAAGDVREGSQARRALVACLTAWGCDRIDDVALVFSELVTNAVLHAGGARRISVWPGADDVRMEVHDGLAAAPVPCIGGPDGGFGLQIIERLSERWGTTPTPTGKVVWAVIRTGCGSRPVA